MFIERNIFQPEVKPYDKFYCAICHELFEPIYFNGDYAKTIGRLREHLIIEHNIPPWWHFRCR